jgi:hypothetical protein
MTSLQENLSKALKFHREGDLQRASHFYAKFLLEDCAGDGGRIFNLPQQPGCANADHFKGKSGLRHLQLVAGHK